MIGNLSNIHGVPKTETGYVNRPVDRFHYPLDPTLNDSLSNAYFTLESFFTLFREKSPYVSDMPGV